MNEITEAFSTTQASIQSFNCHFQTYLSAFLFCILHQFHEIVNTL